MELNAKNPTAMTRTLKQTLDSSDTSNITTTSSVAEALLQGISHNELKAAITAAKDALLKLQHADGHWCFMLESDCTIPAEYIIWTHFTGELEPEIERKLAAFLRTKQATHGGWPLYHGGDLDISCSVKTYYALKLAGDDPDAPHMIRAREAILTHGGAARANVFTRFMLAMFAQIPWRGVPFVPVEIMLLPRWFPFHLTKISYWSRTVVVPLSILYSLKAQAKNPLKVDIQELFTTPPAQERHYFLIRSRLNKILLYIERSARLFDPLIPSSLRQHAIKKAESWFIARLNGEDGLGGIFPAMVNAHQSLILLGYPPDHPDRIQAKKSIQNLVIDNGDSVTCQPCLSPVWDTALASLALQEAEEGHTSVSVTQALDWLKDRQILDHPGDWQDQHPNLKSGGWAFQYNNSYYPDLDDTAVVAWAMDQAAAPNRYQETIQRASDWLCGMQSCNGGFAAFDSDNTYYYLNEIPFADHGALLDPPTADVSARCIALLGRLNQPQCAKSLNRALKYIRQEQEPNGSWFGRWGTNYIYGTWSVLTALEQANINPQEAFIRKAVIWLKRIQNLDGGWGEDNYSYFDPTFAGRYQESTPVHTAWALLALIAAGEVRSTAVDKGVEYLLQTQQENNLWEHPAFNAPGFPRIFYLKYHGYDKFFPLWALAKYRNCIHHPY
ncbi:squalene-hopene cyclase [Candidatus Nitrosoglobus terrae]|uniref:Squalene-hopene cyclase n=1 Tax=Candidatus Nitrosoglobus terrae TaxID=1630141 RepID=A0A1Q2SNE3_9GAMM|nr:squalene--hopene cyclase [Candidatus Nitrosoglobus terrae]BAW80668.1 squalene-hopene cyclase [Candidatus Nitrosoglobus terrae]